jgi:hypothetical protein
MRALVAFRAMKHQSRRLRASFSKLSHRVTVCIRRVSGPLKIDIRNNIYINQLTLNISIILGIF